MGFGRISGTPADSLTRTFGVTPLNEGPPQGMDGRVGSSIAASMTSQVMSQVLGKQEEIRYVYVPFIEKRRTSDGTIFVYGKATGDQIDHDEQIVDRDWARSELQDWFNVGNIRQMHSDRIQPAGKGIELVEREDGFYIQAEIVEPVAVKLIEKGVYTGFSIGIRYPRVVSDMKARGGRINGGKIIEVSTVDYPALGSAKILEIGDAPFAKKFVIAEDSGAGDTRNVSFVGKNFVGKREFSEEERKKLADEGKAEPDGSYPIEKPKDVRNAVRDWGRGGSKASDKKHIISRARAIGRTDLLPADWNGSTKKEKVLGGQRFPDDVDELGPKDIDNNPSDEGLRHHIEADDTGENSDSKTKAGTLMGFRWGPSTKAMPISDKEAESDDEDGDEDDKSANKDVGAVQHDSMCGCGCSCRMGAPSPSCDCRCEYCSACRGGTRAGGVNTSSLVEGAQKNARRKKVTKAMADDDGKKFPPKKKDDGEDSHDGNIPGEDDGGDGDKPAAVGSQDTANRDDTGDVQVEGELGTEQLPDGNGDDGDGTPASAMGDGGDDHGAPMEPLGAGLDPRARVELHGAMQHLLDVLYRIDPRIGYDDGNGVGTPGQSSGVPGTPSAYPVVKQRTISKKQKRVKLEKNVSIPSPSAHSTPQGSVHPNAMARGGAKITQDDMTGHSAVAPGVTPIHNNPVITDSSELLNPSTSGENITDQSDLLPGKKTGKKKSRLGRKDLKEFAQEIIKAMGENKGPADDSLVKEIREIGKRIDGIIPNPDAAMVPYRGTAPVARRDIPTVATLSPAELEKRRDIALYKDMARSAPEASVRQSAHDHLVALGEKPGDY